MVYNLYLNHTLKDQPWRRDILIFIFFLYFTDEGNKATESIVDQIGILIRPEMITKPMFCHYTSFPSKEMAPMHIPLFNVNNEDQQDPEW